MYLGGYDVWWDGVCEGILCWVFVVRSDDY